VKNISENKAQPHALNIVTKIKNNKTRVVGPGATEQGTSLVYYSPAITSESRKLWLDLYLSIDDFSDELFPAVGTPCESAVVVPLFLPYSTCLLSAGAVTKLAGKVGERIFDARPEFSGRYGLSISLPGDVPARAGYALITDDDLERLGPGFGSYGVDQTTGLFVDRVSKEPYFGDVPYAVISLDGTPDETFRSFAPTAASADVLSKFFRAEDNTSLPFETFVKAMEIYNDYHYRTKVDEPDAQIAAMADDSEAKRKKQQERDAYAKRILTAGMKKDQESASIFRSDILRRSVQPASRPGDRALPKM